MTWFFLVIFSFLPAGPGLDRPMVVREQLGPYTIEECFKKKGEAMREAKRMKEKQIGASCKPSENSVSFTVPAGGGRVIMMKDEDGNIWWKNAAHDATMKGPWKRAPKP